MNVSEAIVAWQLANKEIALVLKAKQGDNTSPVDAKSVVDKISASQQETDIETAKKWEYTSPQGREIIRKKLWEIKREVVATQTVTATETVTAAETTVGIPA